MVSHRHFLTSHTTTWHPQNCAPEEFLDTSKVGSTARIFSTVSLKLANIWRMKWAHSKCWENIHTYTAVFLSLSLIFQQVKIEAEPWKVGSKKSRLPKTLFRRKCFIWVTLSYLWSLSVSLGSANIFMCSLYHSREFIFNLLPSVDLIVSKFGLTIQHGEVSKIAGWWEWIFFLLSNFHVTGSRLYYPILCFILNDFSTQSKTLLVSTIIIIEHI